MWLRLTIDDNYLIHDAEAVTISSPFPIWPNITGQFSKLRGLTIGPGWTREVSKRVGGTRGCTHLVELLRPMATTAIQTLGSVQRERGEQAAQKPSVLDTCHALARDSVVVKEHWPDFYTGPDH